jgi:hypothetical protein
MPERVLMADQKIAVWRPAGRHIVEVSFRIERNIHPAGNGYGIAAANYTINSQLTASSRSCCFYSFQNALACTIYIIMLPASFQIVPEFHQYDKPLR